MDFKRVLAVLLAVLGAAASVGTQGTARNRHPGVVTNSTDGKTIDGAYAHAYASMPASSGSCPRPSEALDQRKTENGGKFEFQIDASRASYYAVYCSMVFRPRNPYQRQLHDGRCAANARETVSKPYAADGSFQQRSIRSRACWTRRRQLCEAFKSP